MVSGSSPEADRLGSVFWKRRPNMEYFAGLDVSMEETHVCGDPKRHGYPRGEGAVYARQHCGGTGPSSELSMGPVRNRPDGADALSRLEPTRVTCGLRREP